MSMDIKPIERMLPRGILMSTHGLQIPVGAVWGGNGRFIWAHQHAHHQGQIHLVRDARLEVVSETMVNIYSGGRLYGTLEQMDDGERRQYDHDGWISFLGSPAAESWLRFWRSELEELQKD